MAAQDVADVYQRYFGLIRARCRRILSDAQEAEDVAQETFIRLWKAGMPSTEPAQVSAWVYRTSTRLAIDRLRQRARVQAVEPGSDALASSVAEDLSARVQARQSIAQFARVVPEKELTVALLHRVDGLTHEEVAEVAGMSDRTVRRLLVRFDARLEQLRREEVRA